MRLNASHLLSISGGLVELDDDGFFPFFLVNNVFVENWTFLLHIQVFSECAENPRGFSFWKALKPSDLLIDRENI